VIIAAAACAGLLAAAAPASAAFRFAEPGGDGPAESCADTNPCDLEDAVEDASVNDGDEVFVLPGDYLLDTQTLTIADAIDVHGIAGAPRPRLISSAVGQGVDVTSAGARLTQLEIHYAGPDVALAMSGSTAQRLVVASLGTSACAFAPATVRDSVCWDAAPGGRAVRSSTPIGTSTTTTARNLTAVATGSGSIGISVGTAGPGTAHTFDGRNVIADATVDVARNANNPAMANVDLSFSNFDTATSNGSGAMTLPGSPTNQLSPPQFVNPGVGDFHQAVGSPTIDAGSDVGGLGSLDFDGEPRVQGAAPDIGADEFFPSTQPASGNVDRFPPDTKITDGPKKKIKKRNVKFDFGGSEPGVTFECQLDDGGFEPCSPPQKLKGLDRGAHVYAVRAIDAAGNADPTPADRRWRVKKRNRNG